ncbi:hypothetical protein [Natrononativus amylolyticus]|uniref:hypothetical protein n=1 Tax=Natrononativus amylolyticus TaxID=2963434 RepID=UPI0020CEA3E9|nr:hypothetical protein [Natrononativus amylolyticus]
MGESFTSSETCPWCTNPITTDDGVDVGPPPFAGTDTHRWTLHRTCVAEWHAFAEQLHRLSRIGAGRTLVEYPKNHGADELLERAAAPDGR